MQTINYFKEEEAKSPLSLPIQAGLLQQTSPNFPGKMGLHCSKRDLRRSTKDTNGNFRFSSKVEEQNAMFVCAWSL